MKIDIKSRVVVSVLTLISFLSGHDCAPIDEKRANVQPLHLLEHNSQDDTFASANNNQHKDDNAIMQKILELSKKPESRMGNEYGVDRIDRDQMYSPYFFRRFLSKPSGDYIHRRIVTGQPPLINSKRDGEIYSPYFLKRNLGVGVHAPDEFVGNDRLLLSPGFARKMMQLHATRRQFGENKGLFD